MSKENNSAMPDADNDPKEGKIAFAKESAGLEIDYESLNVNSATYKVFKDLESNVKTLEKEFETLEGNIEEQKKHMLSKIKSIIRYELLNSSKL